jgi:hypothetical protein
MLQERGKDLIFIFSDIHPKPLILSEHFTEFRQREQTNVNCHLQKYLNSYTRSKTIWCTIPCSIIAIYFPVSQPVNHYCLVRYLAEFASARAGFKAISTLTVHLQKHLYSNARSKTIWRTIPHSIMAIYFPVPPFQASKLLLPSEHLAEFA